MSTIVLADDHPVLRQGLRALLEAEPGFSVIGESGDGLETVQLVERLRPDVLVLDLLMPGLPGLEVAREVRRRCPGARVLILSMHASEAYVLEALNAGAQAYVLKKSTISELAHAIREVMAGRRFLSPPLSERAIDAYMEKATPTLDPYQTLTAREREVLYLLAGGATNAQVAGRLTISRRTVEMHRKNLMSKLRLRTSLDLARFALKRGILLLEDDTAETN